MINNSEYETQKRIDGLAWEWFPRGAGFWSWFISTIYLWKDQNTMLDKAAVIGLAIGIAFWLITKIVTLVIGKIIIHLNLWEWGCGCLVRMLAIELFQYFAIATICILAFLDGEMTVITAIVLFIIGALNWFLISFKNV